MSEKGRNVKCLTRDKLRRAGKNAKKVKPPDSDVTVPPHPSDVEIQPAKLDYDTESRTSPEGQNERDDVVADNDDIEDAVQPEGRDVLQTTVLGRCSSTRRKRPRKIFIHFYIHIHICFILIEVLFTRVVKLPYARPNVLADEIITDDLEY